MLLDVILAQLSSLDSLQAVLVPLIIFLAVFIHEDATSVVTAILAAEGYFPVSFAFLALYISIILSDFVLFATGRVAATHPRLQKWVEYDKLSHVKVWFRGDVFVTTFATRFVPGLRFATYIACGFFGGSFKSFAAAVMFAATIWTPIIFYIAYWYGSAATQALGRWKIPVALFVVLLIFFVSRHATQRTLKKKGSL